jgi:hypothetical protein
MMIRLKEKGTTLTWGHGPSSDPGSNMNVAPATVAVAAPVATAVVTVVVVAFVAAGVPGFITPDDGGGGGTGGLTRLYATWARELAFSAPHAVLWRF